MLFLFYQALSKLFLSSIKLAKQQRKIQFTYKKHYKYSKIKGFFGSAEVSFQPPIGSCETEEGRHDIGNNINHLSSNQLFAETSLLIDCRDDCTFNIMKYYEIECSTKGKNLKSNVKIK